LADDVLMEQTVEVRVEHDGLSTVYQWDVQTSLDVILGPDTRFQTERERRESHANCPVVAGLTYDSVGNLE
jgi:hypothetical protein